MCPCNMSLLITQPNLRNNLRNTLRDNAGPIEVFHGMCQF